MNIHATTTAAEGLERLAFTVADIERMVEAGILRENERIELIGGEIVPMSAKGIRHERIKAWLNYELIQKLGDGLRTIPETTFRLSEDTFLEPDFVVYPTSVGLEGLNSETCLLAIEVSDSSLSYDLGRKAQVYAEFRIGELWVINANDQSVRVHRNPFEGAYTDIIDIAAGQRVQSQSVSDFSINLSEME